MKRIIVCLGLTSLVSFGATLNDGVNALKNGDYKTALIIFEDLSYKENNEAQNQLAFMYSKGLGVKEDFNKAKKLWEKAANKGLVQAQNNLGFMYERGLGVRQNKRIAKEWYGKACDKGFQPSCDAYKYLNEYNY